MRPVPVGPGCGKGGCFHHATNLMCIMPLSHCVAVSVPDVWVFIAQPCQLIWPNIGYLIPLYGCLCNWLHLLSSCCVLSFDFIVDAIW